MWLFRRETAKLLGNYMIRKICDTKPCFSSLLQHWPRKWNGPIFITPEPATGSADKGCSS